MPPAIKSLRVQNLLSFGENSPTIDLKPLNVVIGPNASGKSNLIEVIGLLQNTPRDLTKPISEGGTVTQWLWKGAPNKPIATIEAIVSPPPGEMASDHRNMPIRYRLSFTRVGDRLEITDERIENEKPLHGYQKPYLYFAYENGRTMLNVKGERRELRREEINPQQSVLSQRKDLDQYPELTYLGRLFADFRLYRDWEFGRDSTQRDVYAADLPNNFLEEDASNLGLMLSKLRADPNVKPQLLEYLRMFYEEAEDINLTISGGWVDISIEEKGKFTIPAIRLSDGTLRWLSLLTILLHPSPPPFVCIEEPELGLHPDIIRPLAKLLLSASERMQLIVTTHSDALVEELTDTPEAVVVCEKEGGSTTLKRLNRQDLSSWLARYTLGELWRKGEIGGNRW